MDISDVELFTLSETFHGVTLYRSLRILQHSSLSITIIMWYVVSNLPCALSVSWFTLQTIFGISVNDAVHCPCHASLYDNI